MAKAIPLTRGYETIVDDDDFDRLSVVKWHVAVGNKRSQMYASSWKLGKMHRFIINAPEGYVVDHINHDCLDNRKANLRVCTIAQNNQNWLRKEPGKSGFYGVHINKKRFQARIRLNGKVVSLGSFATAFEAANAYDQAAIEARGEFAVLNFGGRAQ